jgi:putative Mn2+ efflux pump MntP
MDTFVLGTALGAAGIARGDRLRTSVILTTFEAGMPIAGFVVGTAIGGALSRWSDYVAAVALAVIGVWMLRAAGAEDEEAETNVRLLESARGWAIVVLGLGVSLDELAIGFGVGLLRLPLLLMVGLIAVQAFVAAQLGMRLGSRIAQGARHAAGRIAGVLLLAAAVLVAGGKLVGAG